jgi:hypothetical protein
VGGACQAYPWQSQSKCRRRSTAQPVHASCGCVALVAALLFGQQHPRKCREPASGEIRYLTWRPEPYGRDSRLMAVDRRNRSH